MVPCPAMTSKSSNGQFAFGGHGQRVRTGFVVIGAV
jgi:hypothetical protein